MICRKCLKEMTPDGTECPLCGANNQTILVPQPEVKKTVKEPIKPSIIVKTPEKLKKKVRR